MTNRHPSVEAVTRFFEYEHLKIVPKLYNVSAACAELMQTMLINIEDDPELTVGLRKLLEAKDCFVRAKVAQINREKGESSEGKPI